MKQYRMGSPEVPDKPEKLNDDAAQSIIINSQSQKI
jgi:hypothetical protein